MIKIENATQFYNLVKPHNHYAFYDYCVFFENHVIRGCKQCGPAKAEIAQREAEAKYMVAVTLNHSILNTMTSSNAEFYSSGKLFHKIS